MSEVRVARSRRLHRATALVLALCLFAAACGGATEDAGDLGEPTPTDVAEVGSSDAPEPMESLPNPIPSPRGKPQPEFIAIEGEIPIWALSLDETRDLYVEWFDSLDTEWLESIGLPSGCAGQGSSPSEPFEACLGRYLMDNGISADAAAFADATGIAVFEMAGDGPVRVLWGANLEYLLTTGRSSEHSIVTPEGIMDFSGWIEWSRVLSEAYSSDAYVASSQAAGLPQYWWFYVRHIGSPEETAEGWSVPILMCLSSDEPCGQGEFAGRFAIDFSEEGEPLGARYLDLCRDRGLATTIEERRQRGLPVDALEGLQETLTECPDPGPWDMLGIP